MQTLWQDIRYALRQLRNAPAFTTAAVLILALGIGGNAAIFTLVHAVLLRNLPVADPKMLMRLGDRQDCCMSSGMPPEDAYSLFSYDSYVHLRATSADFEQLAAVQSSTWKMTVRSNRPGALAHGLPSEFVSGNYFQTMGLTPYAGRLLTASDDQPGAAPVAVITYQAWQRDYALDRSVIGSTFFFKTHPVTIVGITPAGYYGDRMSAAPTNFFLPFALEPVLTQPSLLHQGRANWIYILGRIKSGVPIASAQARLSGNLRQWLGSNIDVYKRADTSKHLAATHVVLTPGGAGIATMREQYESGLKLLMSISGMVLLIACANLANLMLVRATARAAQTSLRMALGAQRMRILRQMLTESLVLSAIGGIAGLAIAYAGTRTLLALAFPDAHGLPVQASPSPMVLAFACALSLLTGLVFGLAPAWMTSRAQPAEALRGSNRATGGKPSPLKQSLVVLQAALSVVLLIGAGLLSRSLLNLEHQDFGLETQNRFVVHIDPDSAGYKPAQLEVLYRQFLDRLRALPGVERVGLASYSPLEGDSWGTGVFLQGRADPSPDEDLHARWLRVSPDMFDLIGQRVLRGRGIGEQDTATAPGVAVVNQMFVKKFFPHGEDPIGAHFGTAGPKSAGDFLIVGVVRDANWHDPQDLVEPMYFRPMLQLAASDPDGDIRGLHMGTIMLQTRGPVDGLEAQVRVTMSDINPNLPVIDFTTFGDQIAAQFTQERLIARLTLLFSALALGLASVGLYGVTSYTVARRRSEIGIRIALGADRKGVVSMVMRQAMVQACMGLAIGVPAALFCVRFVKTQLYGVKGFDAEVLAIAVSALMFSALIAGLIPARRAASIEPMQALRTE